MLIHSWVSLLAAILSVLISYQYSRKGIDAVIDELDNTYAENESRVQESRSVYQAADRASRRWEKTAFFTFVAGIFLMLVFVVGGITSDLSNDRKGHAMFGKRQRITEGLIIGKGPALPPSGVRPGAGDSTVSSGQQPQATGNNLPNSNGTKKPSEGK